MPIDALSVMIQRVVDAEVCPWILECLLIDADGDEHRFIEKEAVPLATNLSGSTIYPQPAQLACVVLKRRTDETGRELALISTTKPWGTESITGATSLRCLMRRLCNWNKRRLGTQAALTDETNWPSITIGKNRPKAAA